MLSLVISNQWFSVLFLLKIPKIVLIWTSLALSPNAIQMLLVAFKVRAYPTSLSVFLVSYQMWFSLWLKTHSWIGSPVISPLEWKHQCRPGNLWKYSKAAVKAEECSNDRRYLWQGRLWLLAWKDKQSVSQKGSSHCNIDAVFIRLVIAKYHSIQVFSCLLGYVWNLRVLRELVTTPLEKQENNKSKFCST